MKECYECGSLADKLSPRSRCVTCEHHRAVFNEKEAEEFRRKSLGLEKQLNRCKVLGTNYKRKAQELEERLNNPFGGLFK